MVKKIVYFLLIALVIAQFFGPEKNQGDLTSLDAFYAETKPSDDVRLILEQACFDCHSNVTKYPWYSKITPINYWMADHVEEGKEELNFSKWSAYSTKRKDHKLEETVEMIEKGKMPLDSYTWAHKDAVLTEVQKQAIKEWVDSVRMGYALESKPQ